MLLIVIPLCGMIVPPCGMIVPFRGMIVPRGGITIMYSFLKYNTMGDLKYEINRTPNQGNGQKKYFVKILKPSLIEFEDVKDELNLSSSVTPGDISAVVEGLAHLLSRRLPEGDRIHINGIGYFSLSIGAPTFDDKENFDTRDIQVRGVNFKPDTTLMKMLHKKPLHFRRQNTQWRKHLADEDLLALLESFFCDNESMSFREFCIITRMPRTTAFRRLKQLCTGERPILRHVGPHNASVYVSTDYAPWRL